MKTPRNYSNLPTFHPVQMERTYIRAEQRLGTPEQLRKLRERRLAWLTAQGLPEKPTDDVLPPIGRHLVDLLKKGL